MEQYSVVHGDSSPGDSYPSLSAIGAMLTDNVMARDLYVQLIGISFVLDTNMCWKDWNKHTNLKIIVVIIARVARIQIGGHKVYAQ